jgi:hypothetical protein
MGVGNRIFPHLESGTRLRERIAVMPIDSEVLALAEKFLAEMPNSRGAKALRALLERGEVSTDDMKQLGYEHPPRALGDVRDYGIPITTTMKRVGSGKTIGHYSFGTAAEIRAGMAGRTNIPKVFRQKLLQHYGPRDCVTGASHDPRNLQIDHRIPFRVAGDASFNVEEYMLLDGKSQRSKSFSCENCENFKVLLKPEICRACYWAFPESYTHVAMTDIRRADIVWQGDEIADFDQLNAKAAERGTSVNQLLKELGSCSLKKR